MMRKLFPLATILAFSGVLAISCDKKDDDNKNETTTETTAETTGGTTVNPATEAVGALSLSNPGALMNKAADALASANVTGQTPTTSLMLDGDDDDEDTVSENDSLCTAHGDPYDAEAQGHMGDSEDYAPRKFYCLVNSGVIESTDTLPGFLKQQASIMCTLKEQLELDIEQFTTDGKQYVEGDEAQSLDLTEACWPQGMPDGQTSVPMNSVIGKALAEDSGWQYEVNVVSEAMGMDLKLRYFAKDGIFGFARYEEPAASPGAGAGMSAIIDTAKGVILFDVFSDKAGEDNNGRTVVRLRVKGTFDENLKFSEINEGRGFAYVSGGTGFTGAVDNNHVFSMYTVDGSSDGGYQFKQLVNSSEDMTTITTRHTKCADSDDDCASSTDIGTTADLKTLAFKSQAIHDAWEGFIDRKPACEPAENGSAAINYSDALIPNTGAFGVCE